MKCINFDNHFATYVSRWMEQNTGKYATYDEMEEDMPNIYSRFLNTPAKWLDGVTPGAYFTQFEDAKDLVDWMNEYCIKGIPVPDLLLEQIVAVGKPCEKRLLVLLRDENSLEEAKMMAVSLLREMDSDIAKMHYVQWQLNRQPKDDLADSAIESLCAMGKAALQPVLDYLPKANAAGQEALLDVLSNFPGNEQAYRLAIRLFKENPKRRALFASYLGKLGDDRALPELVAAVNDDNTTYVDYLELRCAIEELGGTCPEREYDAGDASWAALHRLNDD